MKILFYDTKKYDKESFDKVLPKYEDIEIEYVDSDISVRNAVYAKGFEAVCGFVSSDFSAKVIDVLADNGVKIPCHISLYHKIKFSYLHLPNI